MAKSAVRFSVDIPDLRATLKRLNRLGKEANALLRDRSGEIAKKVAAKIIAAGEAESPQAAMAAKSVRVRRDRVPAIAAGGSKIVSHRGKNRVRGEDVFFGSEFGGQGKATQQFEPHLGTTGYWFFPTVRGESDTMTAEFGAVVDELEREWSSGGDG